MKVLLSIFIMVLCHGLESQPNCEAYKFYGDVTKYEACKIMEKIKGHYQFSKEFQDILDEALLIDSTFSYAYRIKSTAYLKSGDFISWKVLIDKAVKYDPVNELFYRASCRYQFFRDYKGAIEDIELLDSLIKHDIGYSQNGDYHLNIIKALSYKAIGNPTKAIEIFEQHFQDSTYNTGVYDYLHYGVLNFELGNYSKALDCFTKQEKHNDLAENRFYIALVFKELRDLDRYSFNLNAAKQKHQNKARMFDKYVENMDQIFLKDIEKEIEMASK